MNDWSPDVAALQTFDDESWIRVERNFAGRLLAYVARRVPDLQAREDIVQESFLGAVRGIASFDPHYTFEQYLFGICRNRTIDYLRRRRTATLTSHDDEESRLLEEIVYDEETPSTVVQETDLRGQGRELLGQVLREWVQETWQAKEFRRLSVIEALFSGGWRNRDTWQRFELRDETSVAGIKFRALKRLREFAALRDPGTLVTALADQAQDGQTGLEVADVWREERVSCPARHWLARKVAGTLDGGPLSFVDFHIEEMDCPWCRANLDDLEAREETIEPLLERVRSSTAQLLRSKSVIRDEP